MAGTGKGEGIAPSRSMGVVGPDSMCMAEPASVGSRMSTRFLVDPWGQFHESIGDGLLTGNIAQSSDPGKTALSAGHHAGTDFALRRRLTYHP